MVIISFTHTLGAASNTKTLLLIIESQSEGGGGPVLSIKCLLLCLIPGVASGKGIIDLFNERNSFPQTAGPYKA